ncbi:ABC transporter substrate-binding protein [Geitlerinema sp. PCC 9228]|jgi:peptide/nickel transport system substrate-binding protein|uniref:ABC transporter substrate-binding protein n=1 Tax=Geitlerinema sp. PCC 9228 TaxID=111611 RepID=UPI001114AAFB|nr:ABC transporter substrate-binding protein [Geitlerinema sp. PCC 9228]
MGGFSVGCTPDISEHSSPPSSDGAAATAAQDRRITIGTTLNPRTLDPADAYELSSAIVLNNLCETLYTYKLGTTELQPQLATDLPKIGASGLTYTIPLRQDVVFHDGTPFDAQAMVFSLKRFIQNQGRPSFLLAEDVEKIAATGKYEIKITLKRPFAAFPALLTFPGMCAVSPQAYEIGPGKFQPQTLVGTGPYQLANFATDGVRLEAFEQYWGDPPQNQGVVVQRFSTPANLYSAFRTGAVDVAYQSLDPEQIRSLIAKAEAGQWQAIAADGTTITYMTLNINQPPLDRISVRRAIAAAIDRQILTERVFYGQADPLYSLIPTKFDAYQPVFQEKYRNSNSKKAKQLLAEAGFSRDNPLQLEVWYPTGSIARSLAARTIQAIAERDLDGWLKIQVSNVDAATGYGYLEQGAYPTFLVSWYADFFDPDNYIQPFLSCQEGSPETGCTRGASQYQGSFYYNRRANQLIERSRQTLDRKQRQQQFAKLQEILARDVPFIPLWQNKDYAFAQNHIRGVRLEPTQPLPMWTIRKTSARR